MEKPFEAKFFIPKANAKAEQQLSSVNRYIVQALLLLPFSLVVVHFVTDHLFSDCA